MLAKGLSTLPVLHPRTHRPLAYAPVSQLQADRCSLRPWRFWSQQHTLAAYVPLGSDVGVAWLFTDPHVIAMLETPSRPPTRPGA